MMVKSIYAQRLFRHPSSQRQIYSLLASRFSTGQFQPPDLIPDLKREATLKERIKSGILHYWHGSKLLAYETKISFRLILKLFNGEKLIRREYRQLKRTSSDLLRLVPFGVIMIVPFLEFALPLILKLFPNMLPSTFEDKATSESKMQKQLKIKLEMAKFLQETVELMANPSQEKKSMAASFVESFKRARMTGQPHSAEEIQSICKGLSDLITIENIPRAQLVSICKYMQISVFGTDAFLRFQIRNKMKNFRVDDLLIDQEGIHNLTNDELILACHLRGIRSFGAVDRSFLESELKQWLDLHLRSDIPPIIIILSKALTMHEPDAKPDEALQSVIISLPEEIAEEIEHNSRRTDSSSEDFKEKLEFLQQQEGLIEQELIEKREIERHSKIQDTEQLSDALANISSTEGNIREQIDELKDLKDEVAEFSEDLNEMKTQGAESKETKKALALEESIASLILDIERDMHVSAHEANLNAGDEEISTEQLQKLLSRMNTGDINASKMSVLFQRLDSDFDGKISLKQVIDLAKKIDNFEQ